MFLEKKNFKNKQFFFSWIAKQILKSAKTYIEKGQKHIGELFIV